MDNCGLILQINSVSWFNGAVEVVAPVSRNFFSTVLLLLWMAIWDWLLHRLPSWLPLFGVYVLMFVGWFVSVALPLNWYFRVGRRWVTDGIMLGGFVATLVWLVDILIQLGRLIVEDGIDPSILSWLSGNIFIGVSGFLQNVAFLVAFGALAGWFMRKFGTYSASTVAKTSWSR